MCATCSCASLLFVTLTNRFRMASPLTVANELRTFVKYDSETHFIRTLRKYHRGELLNRIVNEKYEVNIDQEMTLLIEATRYGHLGIVKRLLTKCNVDIDATGKIKHFGRLTKDVSALWLAAALGYIEIVKVLIENGATIDFFTDTKSTPLRAASYIGRVDIVEYLFKHGANINVSNIFDCTCLMIASFKGHVDTVKFLLMNGADANKQSKWGATAMHFATQADNIEIVKLLLEFNAQQLKNNQSQTPLLLAAEKIHFVIFNYLIVTLVLTREEIIEAEELLAASYLDDENNNCNELGFFILLHSMKLRFNNYPVIPKKAFKRVEAYDNRIECQTIEDLLNIQNNFEALRYESLFIKERILGETNPGLLESISYLGSTYADSLNHKKCFELWNHAIKISRKNQISIYDYIDRFSQEFLKMIKFNITINLSDLRNVLQELIEEFKFNKKRILEANSINDISEVKIEYFENIYSALSLITVTSIVFANGSNLEDQLVGDILKIIVELNKLELKTEDGQTLLHLCLNYNSNIGNTYVSENCTFPNFFGMKLLIDCGADVNAIDIYNNTPLHFIGKFIQLCPQIPHNSDNSNSKKIVLELLNAGAHTDFVNKDGECPDTGFLKTIFHLTSKTPTSLLCLSSRVLKNQWPKELFHNCLPKSLKEFTDLH